MAEQPSFVYLLPLPGEWATVEDPMTEDEQRKINRRCEEMRRHRDQALTSGANYLVAESRTEPSRNEGDRDG